MVIPFVIGDLNAKVGHDNIGLEEVMRKYGLREINNNDAKLLEREMCIMND